MEDGTRLIDLPAEERYLKLGEIPWDDVFFKTYKETRSWLHLVTNFNRIWIMHISVYWMYCAYNAPTFILTTINNWSTISLWQLINGPLQH